MKLKLNILKKRKDCEKITQPFLLYVKITIN